MNEFPAEGWKKSTLNDLIKHLKQTGSITRKSGSGRPRTAQTTANIDAVDELVLSQEDAPQTRSTVRQIARETCIHPCPVFWDTACVRACVWVDVGVGVYKCVCVGLYKC